MTIMRTATEPGFTATDLTAAVGGGQSVAEGAETIVRLATIGSDGPAGTFSGARRRAALVTAPYADPVPSIDLEPYRAPRPYRADAARNFDAVLEAAREVFTDRGLDAPLEDVAEQAGVGIATLYRSYGR